MTFGWDYPPGVTGGEYEIAGPDREWEATLWCDGCEADTEHLCQSFRGEVWGECAVCGTEFEGDEE